MTLRRMWIEYLGEIPLECDSFNEILKMERKRSECINLYIIHGTGRVCDLHLTLVVARANKLLEQGTAPYV